MLNFDADMIYRLPALLTALTVHEYAHAAVADAMGDPTPRYMGRLTVNPLVHLDLIGTLLLFVAGFGWAKPVPINPRYFRDGRKGMLAVAAAGPGSNLFLAFAATFLFHLFVFLGIRSMGVFTFLLWVQLYNLWFALFNLIPLPPLDGSKILINLLPGPAAYKLMGLEPYSNIILLVVVFSGMASAALMPVAQFLRTGMELFMSVIFR
jgi:Zn-dependent protease